MRLLITVTLNPNQLRAHVEPIADLNEVTGITLVADEPGATLPKLRTVVPPRWLVRVVGRAVAKLIMCVVVVARERPAWILGYNLVPHGITTVLVSKLTGRRSYLHAIGGPVEWEGGGTGSDNKVLSRLRRPSRIIERFLLWVLRNADVVAVMGSDARGRLIRTGLKPERVVVLPASVDEKRFVAGGDHRRWDMVTAVQLIPRKRIHEFLAAVAEVRNSHPDARAAVAGRGPLMDELMEDARRLGIADAVDFLGFVTDIEQVYSQARVFVMTSQCEGLSIAMTEAMAAGVPVIVSGIGEVRDLVVDGENGYIFDLGDVETLVERVNHLLDDEQDWRAMSQNAVAAVRRSSARAFISATNRKILVR
jgi:glycosyltransferase involved in cell wall biosynthesis